MLRPESGIGLGQVLAQFLERSTHAPARDLGLVSARAVRSTIRSWKENRYAAAGRAPAYEPGVDQRPIVLRDRRSSLSTSRTP